jgi:hypothetical protein
MHFSWTNWRLSWRGAGSRAQPVVTAAVVAEYYMHRNNIELVTNHASS